MTLPVSITNAAELERYTLAAERRADPHKRADLIRELTHIISRSNAREIAESIVDDKFHRAIHVFWDEV